MLCKIRVSAFTPRGRRTERITKERKSSPTYHPDRPWLSPPPRRLARSHVGGPCSFEPLRPSRWVCGTLIAGPASPSRPFWFGPGFFGKLRLLTTRIARQSEPMATNDGCSRCCNSTRSSGNGARRLPGRSGARSSRSSNWPTRGFSTSPGLARWSRKIWTYSMIPRPGEVEMMFELAHGSTGPVSWNLTRGNTGRGQEGHYMGLGP